MARILIVDDAAMDRLLARRLLEKNPEFIIAQAEDGAAALLQMEELVPDAVVTDMRMPGLSGMELLEKIREIDDDIAIIILTGYPSLETATSSIERDVSAYIRKPFTVDDFREAITRIAILENARAGCVGFFGGEFGDKRECFFREPLKKRDSRQLLLVIVFRARRQSAPRANRFSEYLAWRANAQLRAPPCIPSRQP